MKSYLTQILIVAFLSSMSGWAVSLSQLEVKEQAAQLDRLLEEAQAENEVTANPLVDDEVFVRRAYLGVVGRIPTEEEARSFLGDTSKDKRSHLVNRLAQSKGYASHQFNFTADLLRLRTNHARNGPAWHLWIQEKVKKNQAYDEFIGEMITASGHATENPAVGYYLRDRGMLLDNVSNTVQTFMGVRMGCAMCHDHPFDDWTQREFYELAAFSADIHYSSQMKADKVDEMLEYLRGKKGGVRPQTMKAEFDQIKETLNGKQRADFWKSHKKAQKAEKALNEKMGDYRKWSTRFITNNEIMVKSDNVLRYPHDYKYNDANPEDEVEAYTPYGEKIEEADKAQLRGQFAEWMTSPDNPYFAKTIANRLWKRTFGQGLAEPLDDWTSGDAVIPYPKLLTAIEELMVTVDYDLREFQRVLWHTQLFQQAAMTSDVPEGEAHDFAGPLLRRMTAEQLMDSMLTLFVGNPDALENDRIESVWNRHKRNVDEVREMPAEDLIEMVDNFLVAFREKEELRFEVKKMSTQARHAVIAGDEKRAKESKKKVQLVKDQMQSLIDQSKAKTLFEIDRANLFVNYNMDLSKANMARVSELPSPFPANAFVRQFGSSDRNLTDNANTQANVPQVLNLMNGHVTAEISRSASKFRDDLHGIKTMDERLDFFYLSLYAAKPTEAEKVLISPHMINFKDRVLMTRAALNSKRFLFIE